MNTLWAPPVRIRYETKLRLLEVARVDQLSPRMRRMTLAGDALDGFASAGADDHVKLIFPAEGQAMPVLPPAGGRGRPDAATAPPMRDYTPRRYDADRRELEIEFVLHGHGLASDWAARAKPGDCIGVGGPRGSTLAPEADTMIFMGDESALPAISRFLEELRPGMPAAALIEVADAGEERHLPSAGNVALTWLHRNGAPAGEAARLLRAVDDIDLGTGAVWAWVAGEIEVARALRAHLMAKGLDRPQIRASGYWRLGASGEHTRIDD